MRKRIIYALVVLICTMALCTTTYAQSGAENEYYPYSPPTDYTATYYVYTGSPTATGTTPKGNRTIAVDRAYLQSLGYDFGATAIIYYNNEFVGYFIAEDTGGLIKSNKIDIYIDDSTDKESAFYSDLMWYGHVNIVIQWVDAKG